MNRTLRKDTTLEELKIIALKTSRFEQVATITNTQKYPWDILYHEQPASQN